MVIDFIFLLILFGLLYSYTNSQNQFAATASAIRQIWSGSCRLSCRHSGHSGLSGLSGLPPRVSGSGMNRSLVAATHGSVPSAAQGQQCSCESCPCALIDNFLRQCRPAGTLYAQLITCIVEFFTFIMQWLLETYENLMALCESELRCTNHQKLLIREIDSTEISLGQDDDKIPLKQKTSRFKIKLDNRVSKTQSGKDDDEGLQVGTSRGPELKAEAKAVPSLAGMSKGKADDVTKASKSPSVGTPVDSDSSELLDRGYCSKCLKKGRTCLSECPRAAQKK